MMFRRYFLAGAAALWALVGTNNGSAQLPTIELQSLSRLAAQVGEPFSLKLSGARLEELSDLLLTDLSGQAVNLHYAPRLKPSRPLDGPAESVDEFEVRFGGEVAKGLIEVRAVGRLGVSNPRLLLLSDCPVDLPSGGHQHWSTACPLNVGHLISDRTVALAANYYGLKLPPGQWLSCTVYGKPLDSAAEIELRLLDDQGRLVISSRSIGAWPAELRWSHESAEARQLYLEVRDLLHRGGENFGYLLEARLIDGQDPSADQPSGRLDALLRPSLDLPWRADRFAQPAGAVRLEALAEAEFAPVARQPVEQFPLRWRGRLEGQQSIDFIAQQGQTLVFDVISAQLAQLTDPSLVIDKWIESDGDQAARWQQVSEQDDAAYLGTAAVRLRQVDPQLLWTAPESGRFRASLWDNQSGPRPADSLGCLLEIRPPQPGYGLIAYRVFPTNNPATSRPWGTQLLRRGTEQIHVTIVRRDGFNDPIELQIEGLPDGCSCVPVIVPAGASEADLVIQAGEEIATTIAPLNVIGVPLEAESSPRVQAAWATISQAASPTHTAVTARRSGRGEVALVDQDLAPLQVVLGEEGVIEGKLGDKVNLPVRLHRQAGSAAECTLRPQALPPKVSLGELKIAGDQSEATIELAIAADAPTGHYTFWLQAETKVKWRTNPQALEREEAYLARLQATLQAADSEGGELTKEQLESAIAAATARIEQLKGPAAEAEYTLWLPSNPVRLHLIP